MTDPCGLGVLVLHSSILLGVLLTLVMIAVGLRKLFNGKGR